MAATPTYLSTLGIAKEATAGTPVAPTNWLRVTDLKPAEKVKYLYDEGLRGSMAKQFGAVPGVQWAEYDFGGAVYVDEIGWVLAGLLNDVAVTGTSDPYTSTFALLNSGSGQPTNYTLTDYNGANSRAFAGMKFASTALKYSAEGMLEFTTHAVGLSFATASFTTASYAGPNIIPNYTCTATLGAAASAIVTDGDLTIKRSVDPVHAADGTAAPASIFAGSDLEVSGSFTIVYDTAGEAALTAYLAGTYGAVTLDWVQSASREFKTVMSAVVFDDWQLNRSQGKWSDCTVKFTALANTTDVGTSAGWSPIKVTTKAANASGTYK